MAGKISIGSRFFTKEELYWQQRGSEKWLLKGDANTSFFHNSANGRRRKTRICSLDTNNGAITSQEAIKAHVVEFYINLFGPSQHKGLRLTSGFSGVNEKQEEADRLQLASPYTEKELAGVICGMKFDSAPGPNEFTVSFFQKARSHIKKELMGLVQDFNRGELDLRRLNYGVITLVPKTKETNTIRKYMPICLLNVDFKIFPKMMTDMITPMEDKLISDSHTEFIKGRNILEGVVILHEVLHEFRRSGVRGCCSKLILKRLMTKLEGILLNKF
jgi:hypothetical protein